MKHGWRRRIAIELAWLVVLGTPVLLFFLVTIPRSHAARLMRELKDVEVSQTQFHAVEALAQQYGDDAACVGDNCLFQFQNVWLHRLRLAPRTEFTVMVRRHGDPGDAGGGQVGVLDMAMLVSPNGDSGGAIASALVFEHMAGDGAPWNASITLDAHGRPVRTVVELSPQASLGHRREARSFNLACLTKVGGCKSSRELLRGVWDSAHRVQSASKNSAASTTLAARH
ncbi:MAG: hypothetical protein ACTHJX_06230 [Terriglobales bacterium]|jgi:hypothetical protein